jgi:hypothetical protein
MCVVRLTQLNALLSPSDMTRGAVCHRFEDIPEVIDDSLPGPVHDPLCDQDVILEM